VARVTSALVAAESPALSAARCGAARGFAAAMGTTTRTGKGAAFAPLRAAPLTSGTLFSTDPFPRSKPRDGPCQRAKVGHVLGKRMAAGKRVPMRVLRSLTMAQFTALVLALEAEGKRLPDAIKRELVAHYRSR